MKEKRKRETDEIELNKSFYDMEAVRISLLDFKDVLSGDVKGGGETIRVVLKDVKGDAENVKNEFCNYILAVMKNRGVV